mgnify:CR=1 FL=1
MTKKHFIELADYIRMHNLGAGPATHVTEFDSEHLKTLAGFCKSQNGNFNKDLWLDYIAGKCGPNGGTIKNESRTVHYTYPQDVSKRQSTE